MTHISTSSPSAVFLTGATGLLGDALVPVLLERGHELWLLARGDRQRSAEERIARLLFEVSPSKDAWLEARARVHVLDGDVRQPKFGLDPTTWRQLADRVEHVVHCAALLNFLPEHGPEVLQSNLEGTRQAYQLVTDADLPTFHFVSTAYVAGAGPWSPQSDPQLEVPCEGQRTFNNHYEESKFNSEQLIVRLDEARGRRTTIYRPSCILGDYETGRTVSFRTVYGFIDLIDQERIRLIRRQEDPGKKKLIYFSDIPRDATRNIVPVDFVARAMAHIMGRPGLHGGIYHLTNPTPPNRWESNRWMTHALDFADLVMPSEAKTMAESELLSFQPGRVARFNKVFSGYLTDHEPRFDTTKARAALEETGIRCPPVDTAYLQRCVRYCLETRWRADVERRIDTDLGTSREG